MFIVSMETKGYKTTIPCFAMCKRPPSGYALGSHQGHMQEWRQGGAGILVQNLDHAHLLIGHRDCLRN